MLLSEKVGPFPIWGSWPKANAEKKHVLPEVSPRIKSMDSSASDKTKGTAKQVSGSVKQAAGKAVGNDRLRAKGAAEKTEGKAQKKVGDIKKVFGK